MVTSTNTHDHTASQHTTNTNVAPNDVIRDFTTQTLLVLNNCNKMVYTSNAMYEKSRNMIEEATSLMISARSTFKEASKLNYSNNIKVARFNNYTPPYYNIANLHNGIPSVASTSSRAQSGYHSDCVDIITSPTGDI